MHEQDIHIRLLLNRPFCRLVLYFLIAGSLNAQDTITVLDGNYLENLVEQNTEQEHDFYTLYDEMMLQIKHPLNINSASPEELRELNILSEKQVQDILAHRLRFGSFIHLYELQVIPSMDPTTIELLRPFVRTYGAVNTFKWKDFHRLTHNIFLKYKKNLRQKREPNYAGDLNHLFLRYHGYYEQNVRLGLTMEKDPGESYLSSGHLPDHVSGFMYIRYPTRYIQDLIIGDYSINMGQGLVMDNRFGGGKSAYVTQIKKGSRSIKPYSSVNERNYLRGIALKGKYKGFASTLFASTKYIDGSLQQENTDRITAIRMSGLHRTQSEVLNRKNVRETVFGFITKYTFTHGYIGSNTSYTQLNKALTPRPLPHSYFAFQGDRLLNTSIDFNYRLRNMTFFGESAYSSNGGFATLLGTQSSLNRITDIAIMYRHYDKNYHSFRSNAFGETSSNSNEQGIYLGITIRPFKQWNIAGYVDIWKHPYLRFQKSAPSYGKEGLVKLAYRIKRKMDAYIQYRYESKATDLINDKAISLSRVEQHRLRMHLAYKVHPSLELRNRLEYAWTITPAQSSRGYFLFQDVIYKPIASPYSFTLRYAIFDIDSFDSRIYAYENDVLYEFSIPFYNGQGNRFYMNNRYRINRFLTLEMRYGATWYFNSNHRSPFLDNNIDDEVKFQVKFKF